MRYWDSSALVPLLVGESNSSQTETWLRSDPQIVTWWLSGIECLSALTRLRRQENLSDSGLRSAADNLKTLAEGFTEVLPVDAVRVTATRLLRVHPLRAADSLQLAAALTAASGEPHNLEFVTFDTRLAEAAEKEGFRCLPELE